MKNFLNKIISLDNIHQWAERDSVIKESVSQHSFKVAAIANYLLDYIEMCISENKTNPDEKFSLFRGQCLQYAILHDFDEAIFGRDVSHTVKYNSFNGENIRKAIDEYVEHTLETESLGIIKKPHETVRDFVKLCDWLAMLTFITRNANMGVKTFSKEDEYCRNEIKKSVEKIERFLYSEFKVIAELKPIINLNRL